MVCRSKIEGLVGKHTTSLVLSAIQSCRPQLPTLFEPFAEQK